MDQSENEQEIEEVGMVRVHPLHCRCDEEDDQIQPECKEEVAKFLQDEVTVDFAYVRNEAKKMAHLGTVVRLIALSKIRQSFPLEIRWVKQRLTITELNTDDTVFRVENIMTDEQFDAALTSTLWLIWNVHKCEHCEKLLFIEDTICAGCRALCALQYKQEKECVVCKDSTHPIFFRCTTCVDSQICVWCFSQMQQKQRRKRVACLMCQKVHRQVANNNLFEDVYFSNTLRQRVF